MKTLATIVALTALLVTAKVLTVLVWPWWLVLAPIWIVPACAFVVVVGMGFLRGLAKGMENGR